MTLVETATGSTPARTVVVDGVTDETGAATFDLTPFNVTEIFNYSVNAIDAAVNLAAIVFASVLTISNTACTCIGYTSNAVTGVLSAAGAGVNVRLVIVCR